MISISLFIISGCSGDNGEELAINSLSNFEVEPTYLSSLENEMYSIVRDAWDVNSSEFYFDETIGMFIFNLPPSMPFVQAFIDGDDYGWMNFSTETIVLIADVLIPDYPVLILDPFDNDYFWFHYENGQVVFNIATHNE